MSTLLALGVGVGFSIWLYRRREVPVPKVAGLMAARALSVALVLLLLINPRIPGGAPAATDGTWTLVDASLSMSATQGEAWDAALQAAGNGPRVYFGGTPEMVATPEAVGSRSPDQPASALAGALRLAAESGARRVRVISDLRLTDLPAAVRVLGRTGMSADFIGVGSSVRNAGVGSLEVTQDPTALARLELFGSEAEGDSATVVVTRDGREEGRARVAIPGPGATVPVDLALPTPPPSSWVRYEARVTLDGDGFPEDDVRLAYVRSGARAGGLVLVSLQPDWEPRFLLPTLAAVTGFEADLYLAAGDGRFLHGTAEGMRPGTVDSSTVRQRVGASEMAVVHGARGGDAWVDGLLRRPGRLLVFPADSSATRVLGLASGPPRAGEWFVEPDAPTSAAGAGLAPVDFTDLPPLTAVLPAPATGWSATLRAQINRQGTPTPVLLTQGGARRVAVAPAGGWWRWAFRGGEGRAVYREVWSGVADWLLGGEVAASGDEVQPETRVVPRGLPVMWRTPLEEGTPVRIAVRAEDGTLLADTALAVNADRRARTGSLPPGTYQYQAISGEADADTTAGTFAVEGWSDELRHGRADVESAAVAGGTAADIRVAGGWRLRTSPIPYLLLIAVLSAEWLLRRRRGLR